MEWASDHQFTLNGTTYRCMTGRESPDDMVILKPRDAIEAYVDLIATLRPQRIMELGIYAGGSTALLAHLAQPERLVALDYQSEPCGPLAPFLNERVTAHYGVDQANTAQLDDLLGLFDGPLDLVIDDASHLEPQTRVSFDRLFPHLRPGGVYVIEDWTWPHSVAPHHDPAYQGVTPLSVLVCELVLLAAARPRIVPEVRLAHGSAFVTRGPADLRPGRFSSARLLDEVGRDMADRLLGARSRKSQ